MYNCFSLFLECCLGSSWANVRVTPGPNPNYLLLKSIWWSLSSCWRHADFHPTLTQTARFQEVSQCWDSPKPAVRGGRMDVVNVILHLGCAQPQTSPPPYPESYPSKIHHVTDEETEVDELKFPSRACVWTTAGFGLEPDCLILSEQQSFPHKG